MSTCLSQRKNNGRTREGHAGELGAPTDNREDEEQPATERPVIGSRPDGGKDSGHYLDVSLC